MTERLAIDYAWGGPSPRQIAGAGYLGVVRYLSHTPSKNLTPRELAALRNEHLDVALVWETSARRAAAGVAAGAQDAHDAEQQADALGYPAGCVIFYAVDFDADPETVRPYFHGVVTAARRPVGVYGGVRIIDADLPGVRYRWQTAAWSRGRVSRRTDLFQRTTRSRTLSGDWDENVIIRDYGAWPGREKEEETPMIYVRLKDGKTGAVYRVGPVLEHVSSDEWQRLPDPKPQVIDVTADDPLYRRPKLLSSEFDPA